MMVQIEHSKLLSSAPSLKAASLALLLAWLPKLLGPEVQQVPAGGLHSRGRKTNPH
jgi:hypothetical protein